MFGSALIAALGLAAATAANPVALQYDIIPATGTGVIRENGSIALLAASRPHAPPAQGDCPLGVDPYGACCATSTNYLPTNHGADSDGWGVWVTNGDGSQEVDLYAYMNSCDYVVCFLSSRFFYQLLTSL